MTTTHASATLHPTYRADIDGLRAIAVLPVVLFHAFPAWLPGGFIGVDVFFVISGFLISTIIFKNLEAGSFSFMDFYARRIKRIFPALLLVLLACYAFGWFALLADEYAQLGKHIAGGASFIANFVLWSEAGYFDNSADTKPLLHLWSLGVEEQFYIVWPLLLWLGWKIKFNLLALTLILAVTSFLLNLQDVHQHPVATFYSPLTRGWELLCGSILAWCTLHAGKTPRVYPILRHLGSGLGFLLLLGGFWFINKTFSFPGAWAIVPVLGALLIILAGPKAWLNRNLLSHPLLVWFGLISFPLYLWHWPLLSFARIVESGNPSLTLSMTAVLGSILLAWLTYRFIERPIRFGEHTSLKVLTLCLSMITIGLIGYVSYAKEGLKFRMESREQFVNYFENSFPHWQYFKKTDIPRLWRAECAFFDADKYLGEGVATDKPVAAIDPACYVRDHQYEKSVLIWGDSHAQALSPGLREFIPDNWQVLQVASSGCIPNPDIDTPSTTHQCQQSNYVALQAIKQAMPDVVVIAQSREHSAQTMVKTARKLQEMGVKETLFLGPVPQWTTDLPKIMARQLWLTKPQRTHVNLLDSVMQLNDELARTMPAQLGKFGARYVDVIRFFCNDDSGCLTYVGDDMQTTMTTWDYGHLTPSGSSHLAEHFLVEQITSSDGGSQ